jgi:L-2-amino-thiazoline-4-carboxylic acid hydrolase
VVEVESREAPEGEIRFDVVSCEYARFFQELGEPELGFLLLCGADGPIAEGPIAEGPGIGFERTKTIM